MSGFLAELGSLIGSTVDLVAAHEADPLEGFPWLPKQLEFLHLESKRKLFRAGNQTMGKTTAGAAELIWRCRGRHPYHTVRAAPITAYVLNTSKAQSAVIQGKVWALCNHKELVDGSHWHPKNGFDANNPTLIFKNGSVVRFWTNEQGADKVESSTIDFAWIDEPCDEEIFPVLDRRVLMREGDIFATLTPYHRPVGWLKMLVEKGVFTEVHSPLKPEHLIPVGSQRPRRLPSGRPLDAEWILEQRRIVDPVRAPVILDGEWESKVEGAFFKNFAPQKHLARAYLPATARILLGVDYAAADREFGQTAIVVAVHQIKDQRGRNQERIHVLGEVVMSGTATNAEFAARVVALLDELELSWRGLHLVHGDNPVESRWQIKSNTEFMKAIARELGVAYDALRPRVMNAKEGQRSRGSRDEGCRYLYERIGTDAFRVHHRCKHLIEALEKWDYSDSSPWKDIIDALRYALKPYIFPRTQHGAVTVHMG